MPRRRVVRTPSSPDENTKTLLSEGLADIKANGGSITVPDTELSDAKVAEMLADDMDGQYTWSKPLGWLRWDSRRWMPSSDVSAVSFAREWVKAQKSAALDRAKDVHTKAALDAARAWQRYLSKAGLEAIVSLARGPLERAASEFDAHPDLLNAKNGVIDLRTGGLLEHDPALLMTKVTLVNYDPEAEHADWDMALSAVPEDARDWYQFRIGQAATGWTVDDDVMVIQQGSGSNGKTTMMVCVHAALRDHYLNVPHRALLADARAHSTELADFRGARCAVLEELPEERKLSVTRLKMLIGTEQITARLVFQNDITFDATHTLFINTNPMPIVTETDGGTWRRLVLMVWPIRFLKPGVEPQAPNERVGDPGLRARMKAGGDGRHEAVLAWIVAGAINWHANGKVMPPLPARIEADTHAWRADEDHIIRFWDDYLIKDPGSHIATSDLFAEVNDWLTRHGHHALAENTFGGRFGGHEVTIRNKVTKGRARDRDAASRPGYPLEDLPERYNAWIGVRFRTKADDEETQAELEKDDAGMGGMGQSKPPLENSSRGKVRRAHPTHPSPEKSWRRSATRSDPDDLGSRI